MRELRALIILSVLIPGLAWGDRLEDLQFELENNANMRHEQEMREMQRQNEILEERNRIEEDRLAAYKKAESDAAWERRQGKSEQDREELIQLLNDRSR